MLLTENGGDSSSSELGAVEIDGRNTDSDVGAYLANRKVAAEYRGAGRAIVRDSFKTFAGTNSARLGAGGKGDLLKSAKRR